jgi:hypothetical protein
MRTDREGKLLMRYSEAVEPKRQAQMSSQMTPALVRQILTSMKTTVISHPP